MFRISHEKKYQKWLILNVESVSFSIELFLNKFALTKSRICMFNNTSFAVHFHSSVAFDGNLTILYV